MLIPDDTKDELFYQLVWYSNFFKKENLVSEKCAFFLTFLNFSFFLVSWTFWDKLIFDSFHVGLAVCSPVDYVEYFPCQKENEHLGSLPSGHFLNLEV